MTNDKRHPANPGAGTQGRVDFTAGDRGWTESFDTLSLAESALRARGYSVEQREGWLEDTASGFLLLPQIVDIQPLEKRGVRTVTTVQCNHPLLVPDGVFEYQHSTGDSAADSISKGFDQWAQMDLVPLLDALQPDAKTCTTMQMTLPAKEARPPRLRRVVLGPVLHYAQSPPKPRDGQDKISSDAEEHPFCPCCLLTNSFEAFKELLEDDGFYGLRLFAARTQESKTEADCRVNGEDWVKGAQALREYAKSWPDAGYEFRKQYVVVQTMEAKS